MERKRNDVFGRDVIKHTILSIFDARQVLQSCSIEGREGLAGDGSHRVDRQRCCPLGATSAAAGCCAVVLLCVGKIWSMPDYGTVQTPLLMDGRDSIRGERGPRGCKAGTGRLKRCPVDTPVSPHGSEASRCQTDVG